MTQHRTKVAIIGSGNIGTSFTALAGRASLDG